MGISRAQALRWFFTCLQFAPRLISHTFTTAGPNKQAASHRASSGERPKTDALQNIFNHFSKQLKWELF